MDMQVEQQITLDEVRDRLAEQLEQIGDTPLTIIHGGETIGVLLSPQAYARIRRAHAYLQMLAIAVDLRKSGVVVDELLQASRKELEERGWS